ncbi:MAG: TrkA family potassium uptake protein [Spirochaetes bacterium]|nr:TrkA family potassium uptake protein [Spirochaetota bacterium]MBU1080377.1 TrkA family potassium uptake protein [Spirochaetota bacterium]
MSRQYAIVGLGSFGVRVLEKLSEATDQIIIIDKDKDVVERYKDMAAKSYIADALSKEALERIIPESIDVAVVDVGDHLEAAIIVANALKKLGAKQIIIRADNEERGEILEMVGATKVVYPAREAATKLVPMLVSSSLFSFMPISPSLVLAEVGVPERYVGSTLVEANFRRTKGINVVAIRKEGGDEYVYFEPRYRLMGDDVLLCAGTEKDVTAFTGARITARKNVIGDMLRGIFGKPRSRNEAEVKEE